MKRRWIKASILLSALSVSTQCEEKFRWKRSSISPQKRKEKIRDCFKQEKQEEEKIRSGKTQDYEKFPWDHAKVRRSYRYIHRSSLYSSFPSMEPVSPKAGQFLSPVLLDSPRYIWTSTNILKFRSHWTKLSSLSSQTCTSSSRGKGGGLLDINTPN